jgi:hypothetical protein
VQRQLWLGFATVMLSLPAFCEQLTYQFNSGISNIRCSDSGAENKRREVITQYSLPKNLYWRVGVTKNEWGDQKEMFCFLEYGGTYYIWLPFHPIWQRDPPIRIVK